MGETWQRLFTDFVANLLRFSMPTHTHDFSNHSNSYNCLKTAFMRSFSGQPEIFFFNGFELGYGCGIGEDYDF
jgi:hypothetical protein